MEQDKDSSVMDTRKDQTVDASSTVNRCNVSRFFRQYSNNEEITYVDIHEIHVIRSIEKVIGTNHFVLLNYELKPLTKPRGLLGDYRTLDVTFLNETGSKEYLHFFVKYFPFLESPAAFAEDIGAFKKEMFVYKLFKEFVKEDVTLIAHIIPKCYVIVPNKYFILDDISLDGYKTIPKHCCLDYDSVLVVLQALAKLHASSIIFEERTKKRLIDSYSEELEESFFINRKDCVNLKGVEACVNCILEEIELFGFSNKLKCGKAFDERAEHVCHKIYEMVKPSKRFRNVLTHGDIWASNILLKYDEKTKKPLSCKLVDFQCGRYAPPAQDVLAFLYLTTSRDFRKKYMYEVVGMYHNYLEKHLRKFDLKIDNILPFTEFLESCEEQKVFAIVEAAFYFPLVLVNHDEIEVYISDQELNHKALFENRIHLVLAHKDKDEFYQKRLKDSIEDLRDICEFA